MKPHRRGFFTSIAATITGAMALDQERLLWVPGKKFISIPAPINRPRPSQFLTMDEILDEFCDAYERNRAFIRSVNNRYDSAFGPQGFPILAPISGAFRSATL